MIFITFALFVLNLLSALGQIAVIAEGSGGFWNAVILVVNTTFIVFVICEISDP